MPQTIAMQRGTGTLPASGNTSATLFTQSGGSATRVITNGITFFASGGYSFMHLIVVPLGGSGYIIGRYFAYVASGQFSVSPAGGLNIVGGGPYDVTTQISASAGNVAANYNPAAVSASQGQPSSAPQTFWIGPGDEVKLRANNDGYAQTYSFSFTTITES